MINIQKIFQYLENKENFKLLINQVSEEIGLFYLLVIVYYAKKGGMDLKSLKHTSLVQDSDLFLSEPIYYVYSNSLQEVAGLLNNSKKLIIISDYKNFKRFSKNINAINGYLHRQDIRDFAIKEVPSIEKNFLTYLEDYPHMAVSEVSKLQINIDNYFIHEKSEDSRLTILDLRKKFFKLKQEGDVRSLFNLIKKEALIKKFSFLTY